MNATGIPPLQVDDLRIAAHEMPVIVVWGNKETSRFVTLAGAKAAVHAELYTKKDSRSRGSKVFEWNGKAWNEIVL